MRKYALLIIVCVLILGLLVGCAPGKEFKEVPKEELPDIEIIECPSDIELSLNITSVFATYDPSSKEENMAIMFEGNIKNNSDSVLQSIQYSFRGYNQNNKILDSSYNNFYLNLDAGMQSELSNIIQSANFEPFPDKIILEITDYNIR